MINAYNLKARKKKKRVSWFNFRIYCENVHSQEMNTFLYIIAGRKKKQNRMMKKKARKQTRKKEMKEGNLEFLHSLSNLEVINKKLKGS